MIEPGMDVAANNLKFADFVGPTVYWWSAQCAANNDTLSHFTAAELRTINGCRGRGCGHANGEGVDMSDNPFAGLAYGLLRNTGEYALGSGSGKGAGECTMVDEDQCNCISLE